MKKIFLSIFLAFATVSSVSAAKLFPDVPVSHDYFEAISALEQKGVINGFGDGTFGPDQKVSRAASLKIILLSAGVEISGVATKNPFPDVPKNQWFAPIVKKGGDIGLVKGDGDGNFIPSRNVSRAEALAMLFRTNGDSLSEPDTAPFTDVPTYAWYAKYFAEAKKKELITGSYASPDHLLTRGELSDLAYRFFKRDWTTSETKGLASYYADFFEGRTTANGETFTQSGFTAAHKTLPFNTRLRVTNTNTLESIVVRINDRGPYAEGKIIDLTSTGFASLAPLSSGIFPVAISEVPASTPLGKTKNCDVDKGTQVIDKNYYDNITLFDAIPKQVRKNEVYTVEGMITGDSSASFVSVFYGTNDEKRLFRGAVSGKLFSIPVFFPEEGEFKFSVLAGDSGYAGAATMYVVEPDCEGEKYGETSAPNGITTSIENGEAILSWNANENTLFRVQFTQGERQTELFVFDENEVILPPQLFKEFSEGIARVTIWGSKADGGALYRQTAWRNSDPFSVFLAQHISRHDNIVPNVSLSNDFVLGETVSFSGTSTENISSAALIIDPNENIFSVSVTLSGNNFSASFTPELPGTYILEINKNDGIMLFVGATHARDTLPVLPDYFDLSLNQIPQAATLSSEAANVLLRLTNKERSARELNTVSLDDNLASLAQFRADDMCDNNYFSHVDGAGKTANDYRVLHGVQTYVAENIVKDMGLVRSHERLMRSAGHRKNIIDDRHARVGFGFCHPAAEPELIVVVQIFGGEPFSLNALPNVREDVLTEINSVRSHQPIVPSVTLESVAQQWANTMAEKNIFSFTDGDDSLEKSLRNAGVNQMASGMVFKISSFSDVEGEFSSQQITISDTAQDNFLLNTDFAKMGIGIAQNDAWEVYLVVLGAH